MEVRKTTKTTAPKAQAFACAHSMNAGLLMIQMIATRMLHLLALVRGPGAGGGVGGRRPEEKSATKGRRPADEDSSSSDDEPILMGGRLSRRG